MLEIDIPNYSQLRIAHLVTDVNGTLALDGALLPGVADLITMLRQHIEVHMLTANTHGKQAAIDAELGFAATIITRGGMEKAEVVRNLGAENVVAIGNGVNDAPMCHAAALGIAVLGPEGTAHELMRVVQVLARDIQTALGMIAYPDRLRATLRR